MFSSDSDLSCLFSWAALSSSWIFLVICSVLRMTSSVLGSVGSASIITSSSSGMELPSPSQLLSLPLLQYLQRSSEEIMSTAKTPACCFYSKDKTTRHITFGNPSNCLLYKTHNILSHSSLCTNHHCGLLPRIIHLRVIECVVIVTFRHADLLL